MEIPMLTAECSISTGTEYHNSRKNILILLWKYLDDARSEAWLNLFWEYIQGKFFAVQYRNWQLEPQMCEVLCAKHFGPCSYYSF
jgi:hypothetical protein